MKRRLALGRLALLLLVTGNLLPITAMNSRRSQKIPRSATVQIHLLKAPGLNLAGSKWDVSYEFRIIAESSLFAERKKIDAASAERAGDLIKKASLKSSLETPAGQTLALKIPFDPATLDKLKRQPVDRLAQGEDRNSQVFLFYSVLTIQDAKLNKTLTIPVTRVWDFANFPAAIFEVNVEINGDGTYSVRSSLIKTPIITTQRRIK